MNDLIGDFRTIYLPIIKDIENKNKFLQFHDNNTITIINNEESRTFFLDNLNSELIRGFSLIKYAPDKYEDKIFEKLQIEDKIKINIARGFKEKHKTILHRSLNHILRKHQRTRIFLFLMGKYFFFGYILFKTIIKILIVYYLYKKRYRLFLIF